MINLKLAKAAGARSAVLGVLVASDRLRDCEIDKRLMSRLGFTGAVGQAETVTGESPALTVLIGIGPIDEVDPPAIRRAAARFVRAVARHKSVTLDLSAIAGRLDPDDAVAAAGEGAALGAYRFDRYKAASDDPTTETVTLVLPGGQGKLGLTRGAVIADAVCFARDLVNEPGGTLTPSVFAGLAAQRGEEAGLVVEVLDETAIAELALGGVIGVNRGSDQPPRFVKMTYTPAGDAVGSIALVGKGITFDAGGLSIKTGDGMMTMKCDMGGAAAVIATMCALPALDVGVRVTSYTPMTDNMLGGDAQRPGDVIRARNGTTIEVLNTDAEGRLVLADALSLATEDSPDVIVDLATLTGACMVALGNRIAGVLGTDEDLVEQLCDAARFSGEQLWPLPLPPEYRKLLDSSVADLKNIGGRYGGTLTAGLFLKEFVGEGISWAHLDIAGPAFSDEADAEIPKGGTGFGVRTLIEWLSGLTSGDDEAGEIA